MRRAAAELWVCWATTCVLIVALSALSRGSTGALLDFLSSLIVAGGTAFIEQEWSADLGKAYRQRAGASPGLLLGSLALPWAFAGLSAKWQRLALAASDSEPSSFMQLRAAGAASSMRACLAAAALSVLLLLWRGLRARPAQRQRGRSAWQQQQGQLDWPLLSGFLATLLLSAGMEAALRGPWSAAALLATAAAACACFEGLLALLPATFTLGEALVAAQAVALLARAALQEVLQLAALQLAEGGSSTASRGWLASLAAAAAGQAEAASAEGRAEPFQRYVVFLTAGTVLCGALLIPLLLRSQQAQQGQRGQRANGSRRASAAQRQGAPARNGQQGSKASFLGVPARTAAVAVSAATVAALAPAALWALRYAASSWRRVLLLCLWGADLAAALPIMSRLSASHRVPGILVRKGYHLLAVSLFLPALLLEPQLLGIALAAAFAALAGAEALRLSGLPGIAGRIHSFMTSFTDARDSGPLLVTHFTLLLGMAAPIWLSNALLSSTVGAAAAEWQPLADGEAAAGRAAAEQAAGGLAGGQTGREEQQQQRQAVWLAGYAGVMILGFGDTAASAVGSLFGRRPICAGSRKTVEGTAAAVAATLAAWALLAAALPAGSFSSSLVSGLGGWAKLGAATALSCLLEGVTTQLDNVFMPLHYFALLCLL